MEEEKMMMRLFFFFKFIILPNVGLVQEQTRQVEEAEALLFRGVGEVAEMELGREKCRGKKRRGLGQLMNPQTGGPRPGGGGQLDSVGSNSVAMLHTCT